MKLVGIIPTLNRPDDIRRLFESIAKLDCHEYISFSIVLVDNSPDANIKTIAHNLACPFNVTYIHQPTKGLSHARNAAITAISNDSDYVCTIDDDLVLPVTFITNLVSSIEQYPDAGMIGGRVELYNQQDLPITIKTSTQHDKYAGGLKLFGFVHGCCMAFSQEVMAQVGEFDTNLGAGTDCGSAEDTDYYYRIWQTGKEIVYCPDWFVYHNHGRRTSEEHNKLKHNYQVGQGAFYYKQIKVGFKHARKLLYWEVNADIKNWFSSFFNTKSTSKLSGKQQRQIITNKWSDRFIGYKNLKIKMQAK
jgi:GT2 family glycosyltransferase